MARAYRMTSARLAAIRKAQRISAQKRRGKKRKRIAASVAVGAVGAGVLGVTLGRYRSRKKGGKVSVVSTTMSSQPISNSKELDIIRNDLVTSLTTTKDKKGEIVDFSKVGTPRSSQQIIKRLTKQQKRAEKAQEGRKSKRIARNSTSSNSTDTVKRNKVKYNEKRRNEYRSSLAVREARSAAYQEAKNRDNPPAWIQTNYYQKRKQKAKMRNILDTLFKNGTNYDPFNLLG